MVHYYHVTYCPLPLYQHLCNLLPLRLLPLRLLPLRLLQLRLYQFYLHVIGIVVVVCGGGVVSCVDVDVAVSRVGGVSVLW